MSHRRLFIPEVVQTSAVDCGPACLSSLLSGFRLQASYGRLREACQTGVDGTSIDTLEELANRLGLEAEQIVLPPDHIALPEAAALPAIAVVKLPSGLTHFVVIWRRHGRKLQLMDPAAGRRWMRIEQFAKELYIHETAAPAPAWKEWTQSADFTAALQARVTALGMTSEEASELITSALTNPSCYPIAMLDAAVRMLQSLALSGAFSSDIKVGRRAKALMKRTAKMLGKIDRLIPPDYRGVRYQSAEVRVLQWLERSREWLERTEPSEMFLLLSAILKRFQEKPSAVYDLIPEAYWSAQPAEQECKLLVRGAVLVRVKGRRTSAVDLAALPAEVAAAVSEPPPKPAAEMWRLLKQDGAFEPAMVGAALLFSALGTIVQALLFRVLIEGGRDLSLQSQRLGAITAVLALLAILLAIEIPAIAALVRMGRRLEARFRIAFLSKLPRIAENYFHSRLTSDMAERGHSVQHIRALPLLAGQVLRSLLGLVLTTAAVIWIDPGLWLLAIFSALVAVGLPVAAQPLLGERELRGRTHGAALSRFYFDALMGLVPIRTHVADGVLRGEHRSLLERWTSAALATQKVAIGLGAIQQAAGFGLAALLAISHVSRHPESSSLLLLIYWGLNIPTIGGELASLACEYPLHRNVLLRLLEPLGALESQRLQENWPSQEVAQLPEVALERSQVLVRRPTRGDSRGVAIVMEGVSLLAGGHTVLGHIDVEIPAGNHVAIIGPSGAGKSSLIGLLLGLRAPAAGTLRVDGAMVSDASLEELRRKTAWIDPSVHLWNRSLVENLRFGATADLPMTVGDAIDDAGLVSVLEKLPDGLQTSVGDSGTLLSGGEGQRVRIGRAMLRPEIQLAILDEPFRGLDAGARKNLLGTMRRIWNRATILFVTHDIADTRSFDQVLVMESGAIVENGAPAILMRNSASRYSALLRREAELKRYLLHGAEWRRLQMEQGKLSEEVRHPRLSEGDAIMPERARSRSSPELIA